MENIVKDCDNCTNIKNIISDILYLEEDCRNHTNFRKFLKEAIENPNLITLEARKVRTGYKLVNKLTNILAEHLISLESTNGKILYLKKYSTLKPEEGFLVSQRSNGIKHINYYGPYEDDSYIYVLPSNEIRFKYTIERILLERLFIQYHDTVEDIIKNCHLTEWFKELIINKLRDN